MSAPTATHSPSYSFFPSLTQAASHLHLFPTLNSSLPFPIVLIPQPSTSPPFHHSHILRASFLHLFPPLSNTIYSPPYTFLSPFRCFSRSSKITPLLSSTFSFPPAAAPIAPSMLHPPHVPARHLATLVPTFALMKIVMCQPTFNGISPLLHHPQPSSPQAMAAAFW